MKRNLLFNQVTAIGKRLVMVLTMLLMLGIGQVWGAEDLVYTLDGTITGGSNGYATNSELTINELDWVITGNTTTSPWRIGGKSLSKIDRAVYSKTAMPYNISKIEITHGTASGITVNSFKLIISDAANDSGTEIPVTFKASATTTIELPAGDYTNKYFKFLYNVTVSGSDNKYLQFTNAKFYAETAPAVPYTVNWYVNGTIEQTQTDVVGTTLTNIPDLEDYDCGGKVFVGWTTQSSYEDATKAPAEMITSTTGMTIPENGEDYYAVFAEASGDGEEGWQKVTSTSEVKTGESYLLISFDEAYYLANVQSTSNPAVKSISKQNGKLSVTDEMKWIATANNDGFEFKSYSNNNYYLWGGSANDAIRINTTSTKANATKVWYTKKLDTYGVVIYHNASTDGAKHLATNGSTDWRNYLNNNTLNNTNRVAILYKFIAGTTYTDYTTQCTAEPTVCVIPKCGG